MKKVILILLSLFAVSFAQMIKFDDGGFRLQQIMKTNIIGATTKTSASFVMGDSMQVGIEIPDSLHAAVYIQYSFDGINFRTGSYIYARLDSFKVQGTVVVTKWYRIQNFLFQGAASGAIYGRLYFNAIATGQNTSNSDFIKAFVKNKIVDVIVDGKRIITSPFSKDEIIYTSLLSSNFKTTGTLTSADGFAYDPNSSALNVQLGNAAITDTMNAKIELFTSSDAINFVTAGVLDTMTSVTQNAALNNQNNARTFELGLQPTIGAYTTPTMTTFKTFGVPYVKIKATGLSGNCAGNHLLKVWLRTRRVKRGNN